MTYPHIERRTTHSHWLTTILALSDVSKIMTIENACIIWGNSCLVGGVTMTLMCTKLMGVGDGCLMTNKMREIFWSCVKAMIVENSSYSVCILWWVFEPTLLWWGWGEGGSWCTCSICHNLTWLFALCMLVYRHVMRVTGSNVSGWIEFNVQCMIHETSDEYTLNTWNINNVGVVTAISNWYSWRFIVLQGLNCMVCLSLHQALTLACLFLTIIVAYLICCE